MNRRYAALGAITLVLLAVAFWLSGILLDEYRISHIRPRASSAAVIATLGSPNLELHPVPDDFLYREPPSCSGDKRPARLMLYSRGRFRHSVLIYLDDAGIVQCVDRRGFMIIGH